MPCGAKLGGERVFCPHCQPPLAEALVNALLEVDDSSNFVRVCAFCEREYGPIQIEPGQAKTHSVCRRHAVEHYGAFMSTEELDALDYAPDLSEQPVASGSGTSRAS